MSEKIRRLIRNINGSAPLQTVVCTVLEVYREKCTIDCRPINGDADFLDVRLRASVNDKTNGVVIYPKKGTEVLVALIENNESNAFVCCTSEIDEVMVENDGGMTLSIKKGVIEINGSKYSLIKDDELKKDLGKVNDLLQALMGVINGAPLTQPGNSPSVLQNAFKGAIAGLQLPTYTTITNEKVKHG